jgi:hypothetical protein
MSAVVSGPLDVSVDQAVRLRLDMARVSLFDQGSEQRV